MRGVALIRIGILTITDHGSGACGGSAGRYIREMLPADAHAVTEALGVPREVEAIRVLVREWASRCDVVLTLGGIGLAPDDVTPEATLSVLDRECPGIAEAIRAAGQRRSPCAVLSRGVAGTIGSCLVVNLEESDGGVQDGVSVLLPVLLAAVTALRSAARR